MAIIGSDLESVLILNFSDSNFSINLRTPITNFGDFVLNSSDALAYLIDV